MKPIFAISLCLLLAACAAQPVATLQPTAAPTLAPTEPQPTATEAGGPAFDAAVYTDKQYGFHISCPAGWFVDDPQSGGSRGGYVQITSWQHEPGGFDSVPEGETVLQIATYLWDPKGDLDARLQMRRTAFEASGATILDEHAVTFSNGQSGVRLLLQGPDGNQTPLLLTTLGDDYLEISGDGDAALLSQILDTFDFDS